MEFETPPDFVVEFIRLFSRMEYALKRSEYRIIEKDNSVIANWDTFSNDINKDFINLLDRDEEFRASVEYLINSPPRKLILEKEQLCWKNSLPENVNIANNIIVLVRRVRNNLFHGEKPSVLSGGVKNDDINAKERESKLIKSCSTILYACLEIKNEVCQAAFEYLSVLYCENLET